MLVEDDGSRLPPPTARPPERRRQHERAHATRHALLVAAGTRFATHGYDGTSLTDLLADGAVTKGALYFHFPSKEALARALVTAMTECWDEVLPAVQRDAADALDALVRLTDAVVVRLDDPIVRGAARVLRDRVLTDRTLTTGTQQWEQQLLELLHRAEETGLLHPHVDPAWVAAEIVVSLAGRAVLVDGAAPGEDLWARMNDFWPGMLRLIATDAWLEHFDQPRWHRRPRPVATGPNRPPHPRTGSRT